MLNLLAALLLNDIKPLPLPDATRQLRNHWVCYNKTSRTGLLEIDFRTASTRRVLRNGIQSRGDGAIIRFAVSTPKESGKLVGRIMFHDFEAIEATNCWVDRGSIGRNQFGEICGTIFVESNTLAKRQSAFVISKELLLVRWPKKQSFEWDAMQAVP